MLIIQKSEGVKDAIVIKTRVNDVNGMIRIRSPSQDIVSIVVWTVSLVIIPVC